MKITTLNVVMFGIGSILVYSGIMAFDPRDVIKWGLGGKKPTKMLGAKEVTPKVDPKGGNPGDVPRDGDGPIIASV